MTGVSKVLIVGAGIGGLSAAIAARQQGIAVDIVEIQPRSNVYGVGIIQHGNVVRAMAHLGLLQRYLDRAFAFEDVGQYDVEGRLLRRIRGERLAGAHYPANVGISRLELHRVLVAAAREYQARLSYGTSVREIQQDGSGVEVQLTGGERRRYDLLVGADGVHSQVRELVFGPQFQPRLTGQSVWRHNFARDPSVDHLCTFAGPRGNAGLCPLAGNLMYMYLTSQEPGNPRLPAEHLPEMFRERLAPFGGIVRRLRPLIVRAEDVVYRPLEVIFMPAPWYRGRVLLIGDAAHATTPHLGQGAGMAIEDAVVLADLLGSGAPADALLPAFMERRLQRCRFISESSIRMGDWEMRNHDATERFELVREVMTVAAEPI